MTEDTTQAAEEAENQEEEGAVDDEMAKAFGSLDVQVGNAPDEEVEKIRPVCMLAEQQYNQILEPIKEMQVAQNVLSRFHAQDPDVTAADVEAAKEKFEKAKQSYLQSGNQINEGIKSVYQLAKGYPNDHQVQLIYQTYLAKLLASLETRNPLQPYVEQLALYSFEFERDEIIPTELEVKRELTKEELEKERLESVEKDIKRLESRYTKRLLANKMRKGGNPRRAIRVLKSLSHSDPDDINTYIWLANLQSDELKKCKDQNQRISLRNDILDSCQQAFAKIDDFLNLQGIENLNERDRKRAEYVKTITTIRKPLVSS